MKKLALIAACVAACIAAHAADFVAPTAPDHPELVRLSHFTFSGFKCAAFAEMANKTDEAKRLNALAMKAGRAYLSRSGEVTANDHWFMSGYWEANQPSADFALGKVQQRMQARARDEAGSFIFASALIEFEANNCELLGREVD